MATTAALAAAAARPDGAGPGRRRLALVAAQSHGGYVPAAGHDARSGTGSAGRSAGLPAAAGRDGADGDGGAAGAPPAEADRLAGLAAAVDALLAVAVDELDEATIRAELGAIETARRRLEARAARDAAALTFRQARRAHDAQPRDARAGERAARDVRRQLVDEFDWTPTQAKDAQRLGRTIDDAPELAAAFDTGQIPPRNAQLLARTCQALDPDAREAARARLAPAAREQDPTRFGRTCRAVLAELDAAAATRAEDRRHQRRKATLTVTDDGMHRLYAEHATVDGQLVTAAIHAYRRPDAPDEHRTPEQATADALTEVCRAALQGHTGQDGQDGRDGHPWPGRNRGVRPHVVVTIPLATLKSGTGPVELDGATVPLDAVRHLLDDAGWSFVLTGQHDLPTAVTNETRTVPVGLWRALVLRDRGCIHHTCDLPAAWTDVMHLHQPYRGGTGRLSLDNAALGCRRHHRAYDNGHLRLHHHPNGRPVLRPPDPHNRDGPAP